MSQLLIRSAEATRGAIAVKEYVDSSENSILIKVEVELNFCVSES
jgi:hypothetical protein